MWTGSTGTTFGCLAFATALAALSNMNCGASADPSGIVHAAVFQIAESNVLEEPNTAKVLQRTETLSPGQNPEGFIVNPGTLVEHSGLNPFGNGCCIGAVDGGDWGLHDAVDFGTQCAFDKVILYYATPNAGGVVRLRLDNGRGAVVGEVTLIATGADFASGGMVTMELAPIRGKHPLFVEFIGGFGIGNFTGYSFQASGNRKSCPKQFLPK